ncbi:MAG: hypothetical protein ACXAB7_12655 [Candidatus Kariarchaeaceae archaeon]|jgi:UDP-N-acetylglucosamine--dolichyl-phosphate N-acetylglucosaminephosphotransferase
MTVPMVEIYVLSIVAFFGSLLVTPRVGRYMSQRGKVGNDVHKINLPEVPESGGIGFMFIYLFVISLGIFIAPSDVTQYRLALILVILLLVTILGLYDDFNDLSAILKPVLLVLLALPVFLFRSFHGVHIANPNPILPFVGATSLNIVYWGLAIFVVAIPSNASNMLDVMNGVMSGSGILIGITAFLSTYIIPLSDEATFIARYASLTLVGSLLGFWWYNRYPAKIFAGDTGSLGVGAAIGLIAIYGEIEFVMVVALLVHIMNSFSILSSLRGLRERREIKDRPVRVENGVVHASRNKNAPITEIIRKILILVFYCCILALLSAYLIRLELS